MREKTYISMHEIHSLTNHFFFFFKSSFLYREILVANFCPVDAPWPLRGAEFGEQRCVTPKQTSPLPNDFECNLRSKTQWLVEFCNSHKVSHFTLHNFCIKLFACNKHNPSIYSSPRCLDWSSHFPFQRMGSHERVVWIY